MAETEPMSTTDVPAPVSADAVGRPVEQDAVDLQGTQAPPNPPVSADGAGNAVADVIPPISGAQAPANLPPSYPPGATGASASWWSGDPEIRGATSEPVMTSPPR